MLGWFQALMPKEEAFFGLFERHAAIVVAGAEAMQGLLRAATASRRTANRSSTAKTEADEITRQVLTALRRSFITPFDRADIQRLISSMDDSIDQMNKTAKTIMLFEVRSFEPPMQDMAEDHSGGGTTGAARRCRCCSAIGKNADRLNALTEKIIRVEERADQLYDEGRKQLYHASLQGNAMNFVIGAEIYDHLEKVVDRFEDVSNEMNAIVTDHL